MTTAAAQWRWLLRDEPGGPASTQDFLQGVVTLVPDVVSGTIAASVTELDDGTYSTPAASSVLALELDVAQYTNGAGPCMTAARDRQVQLVPDTAAADRFAGFGAVAARHGVRSSMSVPFRMPHHPAALNIYATERDAFGEHARLVAEFLGRALGRRLLGSAGETVLTPAESTRVGRQRALVLAAMSVIADPECTPEERFAALVARSVRDGCSIYTTAEHLAVREGAA